VIPTSECDWLIFSLLIILQIDGGEEKRNPVLDFPESLLVEDDQPVAMVTGGEDEEGAISDPGSEMVEDNSDQVKVYNKYLYFMVAVFNDGIQCVASGSIAVVSPCGSLPRLLQRHGVSLGGLHASPLLYLHGQAGRPQLTNLTRGR
jgi:hypothetical protein